MTETKILHKRSKKVIDGVPALPTESNLEYGEVAINYAHDNETIAIRNSYDEIVPFKSQKYVDNAVKEALKDVEDKYLPLSGGTMESTDGMHWTTYSAKGIDIVDGDVLNEATITAEGVKLRVDGTTTNSVAYWPLIKAGETASIATDLDINEVKEEVKKEVKKYLPLSGGTIGNDGMYTTTLSGDGITVTNTEAFSSISVAHDKIKRSEQGSSNEFLFPSKGGTLALISDIEEAKTNVKEDAASKYLPLTALTPGKGENSVASPNCNATASNSVALGDTTTASGVDSYAEGNTTTASGENSHAEGWKTQATNNMTHAEGNTTTASGENSHAEGWKTTASGTNSHTEGGSTIASGVDAHAEGGETTASGEMSHSEGNKTTAEGDYSHAEGISTTASGVSSHVEGNTTQALGIASHAEGFSTIAGDSSDKDKGRYAHAEGYSTTASGNNSHAEGGETKASGVASHAEGNATTASENYSHAEGNSTTASGEYGSHAEGNNTTASGDMSHAEGDSTEASGDSSHAEGAFTIASGEASHAEGRYNVPSTLSIHSVGIGNNNGSKNAEDITYSGAKYLIGLGGYNGTNLTVTNGGTESINPDIKSVQEILNKLIEKAGGLSALF